MTKTTPTQINKTTLPAYVDIDKWADQGYHWQGNLQVANFKRLAEVVSQSAESVAPLSFSISRTGGVYWFEFTVTAEVESQCQRCLQPMTLTLDKQVKLAILENEEQASQLTEDDDWILIEDVAEIVGREIRLPIASVIEDELLLEIPLSPKHKINDEDCVPVDFIEDDEEEEAEDEKENPFAILAGLKGKS